MKTNHLRFTTTAFFAAPIFWRTILPLSAALAVLSGCQSFSEGTASCCDEKNKGAVANAGASDPLSSDWAEPSNRPALNLAHPLTRHDGASIVLKELAGQPLAISFAYTRCMNPNKCRAVTTTMGTLQRKLGETGLREKVKLVLITYDAQYDTPQVMRDYATRNQLALDEHALYLRPGVDPEHKLFRDLGVNASFNQTGVAIHGIQLLLVDKLGRVARTYRTLIWDNEQVAKDLERLAKE